MPDLTEPERELARKLALLLRALGPGVVNLWSQGPHPRCGKARRVMFSIRGAASKLSELEK
jgi:hypothetical protein